MTETTQVLHDRLMTRLRASIAEVADLDSGSGQAVEVAATALVDMLAIVLARLPAAQAQDGAVKMGMAMGNRLVRRLSFEVIDRGTLIDFGNVIPVATTEPAKPSGTFNGRAKAGLRGSAANV